MSLNDNLLRGRAENGVYYGVGKILTNAVERCATFCRKPREGGILRQAFKTMLVGPPSGPDDRFYSTSRTVLASPPPPPPPVGSVAEKPMMRASTFRFPGGPALTPSMKTPAKLATWKLAPEPPLL